MNAAQARIYDAALRLFARKGSAQLTISELAAEAGVARGTIYNNIGSLDSLLEEVAGRLSAEMHRRVFASFEGIDDPARRLANGIRLFVRRAHDEPDWGRFFTRFAMSEPSLQVMWDGPPVKDLRAGVRSGRYSLRGDQITSAIALIAGSTVASMLLVVEGRRTFRDAGSECAELVLRSLGVEPDEARRLSTGELPRLPLLEP